MVNVNTIEVRANNLKEFILKINSILKKYGFYVKRDHAKKMHETHKIKKKTQMKNGLIRILSTLDKQKVFTQKELARELNVSEPTLRKYFKEIIKELKNEGYRTDKIILNI